MNGSGKHKIIVAVLCVLILYVRIYKIPDGKPENTFAFSGEAKNKKYATEIIHECHEAWRRLITGETPAKTSTYELSMYICLALLNDLTYKPFAFNSRNITIQNSPGFVKRDDPIYNSIPADSRVPPAPVDPSGELKVPLFLQ